MRIKTDFIQVWLEYHKWQKVIVNYDNYSQQN